MSAPEYTLEMAREDIAYAVDTFGPDTTYADRFEALTGTPYANESCQNKIDDEPACIVGVALAHRFGAENIPRLGSSDSTLSEIGRQMDYEIDDAARTYLSYVQRAQDIMCTWGEAQAKGEWGMLA